MGLDHVLSAYFSCPESPAMDPEIVRLLAKANIIDVWIPKPLDA